MRIAVIGAGIAGLTAAHRLAPEHDVTIFEAGRTPGGHTYTVDVATPSGLWPVDMGFIVFNDRNYPHFEALLRELDVASQPTHMGFSVAAEHGDFEFAGTPRGLFAQRSNLLEPRFHRMLADLLRFNGRLRALLAGPSQDERTLGELLETGGYGEWFAERLIVPQASAIWSLDPADVHALPARFFAHFFNNHGLLAFRDRPRWKTITGGSTTYVRRLVEPLRERLHVHTPVVAVTREEDHVSVVPSGAEALRFDEVVLACHADQSLALLTRPSPIERELLSAFSYQPSDVVLHVDDTLLPRRAAVRQAWNVHLLSEPKPVPTITYGMNHLQRLATPERFCVSLNMTERIDPAKVLHQVRFEHPVHSVASVAAQARHDEISGVDRIHYCGAYWGWGFHEDGVRSALDALAVRAGAGAIRA